MSSNFKLTFFDSPIIHLDKTESTNDYLKANPVDKPTLVFADFQTKGRGQRGKFWESNSEENILVSVSIPIHFPAKSVSFIPFNLSIALYFFFENLFETHGLDEKVNIKWPNDVILHDKKIMGILIESVISGEKASHIIIGLGFNVLQTKFSGDNPRAASLASFFPEIDWKREIVLEKLIHTLETFANHLLLYPKEFIFFNENKAMFYNKILYKLNKPISIKDEGLFINQGVDLQGNLILKNSETQEILLLNSTSGIEWDY